MRSRWSYDSRWAAFVVTCIFLFCQQLDARISLPLDGYCKPGRFFPISVDGNDAVGSTTFQAVGCFSSFFAGSRRGSGIVPMLAINHPHQLSWPTGSLPLLDLKENERLIGVITNENTAAAKLFPADRLIAVQLDPVELLPGPPVAWESLDAIVLEAPLFQRLSDTRRSTLLASGVILAAIGQDAPDTRWPWRRRESLWVLHDTPAGPNQLIDENVYSPTYTWKPGYAVSVRWQVMGAATLLVLITTALLLQQNRFVPVVTIGFLIIASLGFAGWKQSFPIIDRIGGDVLVNQGNLIQRDQWVFERAKDKSLTTVPWSGATHPVFSSPAALDQAGLQVNVAASGDLAFVYRTMRQRTMAFIRREIEHDGLHATDLVHQSPMQDLVNTDYLQAGDQITGEFSNAGGRWPSVVIQRKNEGLK